MNDARDLGSPRGESPMPLTRRELRQRREVAAIAEASKTHPDAAPAEQGGAEPAEQNRTEPAEQNRTEQTEQSRAAVPPAPAILAPRQAPLAAQAAAEHTPAPRAPHAPGEPARPPGGVSFGSLAGMFADPAARVSPLPSILTVCTGNICRSPLAETLLRTRLGDLDVRVHSAGTHALVGHAMTDPAQHLARDRGVDAERAAAHRARLLTEPLLDDADLILTMTAEQRGYALRMLPRRLHRIFSVREFARLAQGVTDAEVRTIADRAGSDPRLRLVSVVEAISDRRGGPAPQDEDVVDPYRRPFEVYEESAAQLTPALAEIERVVRCALA